jgi:hypothetical protein
VAQARVPTLLEMEEPTTTAGTPETLPEIRDLIRMFVLSRRITIGPRCGQNALTKSRRGAQNWRIRERHGLSRASKSGTVRYPLQDREFRQLDGLANPFEFCRYGNRKAASEIGSCVDRRRVASHTKSTGSPSVTLFGILRSISSSFCGSAFYPTSSARRHFKASPRPSLVPSVL